VYRFTAKNARCWELRCLQPFPVRLESIGGGLQSHLSARREADQRFEASAAIRVLSTGSLRRLVAFRRMGIEGFHARDDLRFELFGFLLVVSRAVQGRPAASPELRNAGSSLRHSRRMAQAHLYVQGQESRTTSPCNFRNGTPTILDRRQYSCRKYSAIGGCGALDSPVQPLETHGRSGSQVPARCGTIARNRDDLSKSTADLMLNRGAGLWKTRAPDL